MSDNKQGQGAQQPDSQRAELKKEGSMDVGQPSHAEGFQGAGEGAGVNQEKKSSPPRNADQASAGREGQTRTGGGQTHDQSLEEFAQDAPDLTKGETADAPGEEQED